MSSLPKVALAGATGNLGPAVLNELLDAGISVTVLKRQGSSSKVQEHPNLVLREVDYNSQSSLVAALHGINVVVSNLHAFGDDIQAPLIKASIAAGVSRFLPSEFGSDIYNPLAGKLPIFQNKLATRKQLEELAVQHPEFSYSYIVNGPLLDWALGVGFLVNVSAHKATLFNGGDVPFSTARLSTVGKAVVGVVKNLDATKNRTIYIHDGVFTQNQLIAAYKKAEKGSPEWETEIEDTNDTINMVHEELKKPNPDARVVRVGFLRPAIFDERYGNVFKDAWNEKFGIPTWNETDLDKFVESLVVKK